MTEHVHGLTQTQIDYLLSGIHAGRIRQHRGNSHVEAWDDRRTLIRAFGFTGFDIDRIACELVAEDTTEKRDRWWVIYRYELRLTVKCVCGHPLGHWDEVATGDSQNQPVRGDAHDQAVKTAASQALKRACVNVGDQFGLSLYNDGGPNPVVIRSAAYVKPGESEQVQQAASEVQGGELDEQATAAEQPDPPAPEPENQDSPGNDRSRAAVDKWIAGFQKEVAACTSLPDIEGSLHGQLEAADKSKFLDSQQVKELEAELRRRWTQVHAEQQEKTGVSS